MGLHGGVRLGRSRRRHRRDRPERQRIPRIEDDCLSVCGKGGARLVVGRPHCCPDALPACQVPKYNLPIRGARRQPFFAGEINRVEGLAHAFQCLHGILFSNNLLSVQEAVDLNGSVPTCSRQLLVVGAECNTIHAALVMGSSDPFARLVCSTDIHSRRGGPRQWFFRHG